MWADGEEIETAAQGNSQALIEAKPPKIEGAQQQCQEPQEGKHPIGQHRQPRQFPPDPPEKIVDEPQKDALPPGNQQQNPLPGKRLGHRNSRSQKLPVVFTFSS